MRWCQWISMLVPWVEVECGSICVRTQEIIHHWYGRGLGRIPGDVVGFDWDLGEEERGGDEKPCGRQTERRMVRVSRWPLVKTGIKLGGQEPDCGASSGSRSSDVIHPSPHTSTCLSFCNCFYCSQCRANRPNRINVHIPLSNSQWWQRNDVNLIPFERDSEHDNLALTKEWTYDTINRESRSLRGLIIGMCPQDFSGTWVISWAEVIYF